MVENVRFYAPKVTIAFSEALYSSIRTDLRLVEALKSLTIESRHLPDHWSIHAPWITRFTAKLGFPTALDVLLDRLYKNSRDPWQLKVRTSARILACGRGAGADWSSFDLRGFLGI